MAACPETEPIGGGLWVQCDDCDKWRVLDGDEEEDAWAADGRGFVCSMIDLRCSDDEEAEEVMDVDGPDTTVLTGGSASPGGSPRSAGAERYTHARLTIVRVCAGEAKAKMRAYPCAHLHARTPVWDARTKDHSHAAPWLMWRGGSASTRRTHERTPPLRPPVRPSAPPPPLLLHTFAPIGPTEGARV